MPSRSRMHRLLPPLPATGVANAVERRLVDAIDLGLLAPGEQLPSESDLAAQLGVSTVTLREALAALRRLGMVETRRGRHGGTFVYGPSTLSEPRLRLRLLAMSVIDCRDFCDEWSSVAGTTARLAAARSSRQEVFRMRSFAVGLGAASSIGDRSRAHSRFFIEVALASQSERLTRSEVRLQAQTGDLLWLPSAAPFEPAEAAAELQRIADAIREGRRVRWRDLAERHVQRAARWLIETRLSLADQEVR